MSRPAARPRPAEQGIVTARTGVNDTRIIGMRRKIAEKMQEAKRRIPTSPMSRNAT
jgi:pyruvate/2-oxoglutarate dehydrogenase complex dihydrolipoamide acyltransferase (E2) component